MFHHQCWLFPRTTRELFIHVIPSHPGGEQTLVFDAPPYYRLHPSAAPLIVRQNRVGKLKIVVIEISQILE